MAPVYTPLPEKLRARRLIAQLSRRDLASQIGVYEGTIAKWECGQRRPNEANIMALCRLYDCEFTDLCDLRGV